MEPDINYIARDFSSVLPELRAGMCEQELTEKLNEVTKACLSTGKAGSVTLTLKIIPQGTGQAIVGDTIKAVVPEFSKQPTIMFIDADSNLVRKNPKQLTFGDIVQVGKGEDAVSVNEQSGEVVDIGENK